MAALSGRAFLSAVAGRRRSARLDTGAVEQGGLRFAFYGRMSTSEFQDAVTSRAWQRSVSEELVEGFGAIVVEFFDEGCSRRWSWSDRPAASALLTAAEEPGRGFDAVVVGEYERAFYGDQFRQVVARLNAAGVQVWLPEAGGPVELDSPVHEALMVLLGAQAQREVVRARHRVLAAMRVQARVQGRFLGGRPPYGYRLVDAGPHPNAMHARWGRRLHVLEPDPVTAPWVEWIFTERAGGRSVASLVRELNDRGVPCPSSADPGRNGHRSGGTVDRADGGDDLRESAIHGPAGVEPAEHSGTWLWWARQRPRFRRGAVESGGRVGGLRTSDPPTAGRRCHVPRGPGDAHRQDDQGRRDPALCAGWVGDVWCVRSADGRALGARPGWISWISLSTRVQQCCASPGGRATQCVRARRPSPRAPAQLARRQR